MKVLSLFAPESTPRHVPMLQGNAWFRLRGYEVISFERHQLSAGEFDDDLLNAPEATIVYASVGVVTEALERGRHPPPPELDYPVELAAFTGRTILHASLGTLREMIREKSNALPVHVKPRERQKLFTGRVVGGLRDILDLVHLHDDVSVYLQDVVPLRSEWRASILRGAIIHVAHYKGDPLSFPDRTELERGLAAFRSAPIACAMDWGITGDGRTILVEVNDGFALGNYGVSGSLYTAMIECRWRELTGLADNGVGQVVLA